VIGVGRAFGEKRKREPTDQKKKQHPGGKKNNESKKDGWGDVRRKGDYQRGGGNWDEETEREGGVHITVRGKA